MVGTRTSGFHGDSCWPHLAARCWPPIFSVLKGNEGPGNKPLGLLKVPRSHWSFFSQAWQGQGDWRGGGGQGEGERERERKFPGSGESPPPAYEGLLRALEMKLSRLCSQARCLQISGYSRHSNRSPV